MEQNYFQYNNQYYKPQKGVTMGSPSWEQLQKFTYKKLKKNTLNNGWTAKKSAIINDM